jgi:hypothetical protein
MMKNSQTPTTEEFYFKLGHRASRVNSSQADFIKWVKGGGTSLLDVYESAEMVWTDGSFKLLSVYKGYLIWFWPLVGANKQQYDSSQLLIPKQYEVTMSVDRVTFKDPLSKFSIAIEGFCSIKGVFIESSEGQASNLQPNTTSYQSPIPGATISHKVHDTRNSARSMSPLQINVMRPYFLKIWRQKGGKASETLYFHTKTQYEDWRVRLGSNLVFFSDFNYRYKMIESPSDTVARKDSNQAIGSAARVLKLENMLTREKYIGRVYRVADRSDKIGVNQHAAQQVKECGLAARLQTAGVVVRFKELFFEEDLFVVVEEAIDGVPFPEWFSNTWCHEYGDQKDPGPILTLMIDLTALVYSMTLKNISHGSICKDKILVKEIPKTPSSRTPSPNNKLRKEEATREGPSLLDQSDYLQKLYVLKKSKNLNKGNHSANPDVSLTCEPQPILKKARKIGYQLVLRDLEGATDLKPTKSYSSLGHGESSEEADHRPTDIRALGLIMCEILFGVDIMAESTNPASPNYQFATAVLESPQSALMARRPRFEVPSQMTGLISRQLSPTAGLRPSAKECYETLVVFRAQLGKEQKSRIGSAVQSRLSFDTLKSSAAAHTAPNLFSYSCRPGVIPITITQEQLKPEGYRKPVTFNNVQHEDQNPSTSSKDLQVEASYSRINLQDLNVQQVIKPKSSSFSLMLPNGNIQRVTENAKTFKKIPSGNGWNLHNSSTVDNRNSHSDILKSGLSNGASDKRSELDCKEPSLRHYRSFSSTPMVCLSGRALFSRESKPKQVVPGNGDSVQTITSGSNAFLKLKGEVSKGSLRFVGKPENNWPGHLFTSTGFRAQTRKNSCPTMNIQIQEPHFKQSVESSSENMSGKTERLRPAITARMPAMRPSLAGANIHGGVMRIPSIG